MTHRRMTLAFLQLRMSNGLNKSIQIIDKLCGPRLRVLDLSYSGTDGLVLPAIEGLQAASPALEELHLAGLGQLDGVSLWE